MMPPAPSLSPALAAHLRTLAARYETPAFIHGDPSSFMHQVAGDANREATAFVAAALSYGSRRQFLPKIQTLLDAAHGDIDTWLRRRAFATLFPEDDTCCFYRLHTVANLRRFLDTYADILTTHDTLGDFLRRQMTDGDALTAIHLITSHFARHGSGGLIPKDATSACKRVCMFLRWMVRTDSPVDLGLWADFIDRRSLIMPMDTHVLQEARRLGVITAATTSMSAARRLTATLASVFPEDPLRGDFALFGLGVDAE